LKSLDSCSPLTACEDKLRRNDVIPVDTGIQEGEKLKQLLRSLKINSIKISVSRCNDYQAKSISHSKLLISCLNIKFGMDLLSLIAPQDIVKLKLQLSN